MNRTRYKHSVSIVVVTVLLAVSFCSCSGRSQRHYDVNEANAEVVRSEFQFGGATSAPIDVLIHPTGTPQWATLSGRIQVRGTAPKRKPPNINRDPQVCSLDPKEIRNHTDLVGPSGGLRNALVYLSTPVAQFEEPKPDEPIWVHPDFQDLGEAVLDQEKCVFTPHVFVARTGQNVLFKNSDPVAHNANYTSKYNGTSSATIAGHTSFSITPERPEKEPFPVTCDFHRWMKGYIIFVDSPYFAVTDENGNFTIENVPAGMELEFKVWHEALNRVTSVEMAGSPQVKKGKFAIQLDKDKSRNINVTVDASLLHPK